MFFLRTLRLYCAFAVTFFSSLVEKPSRLTAVPIELVEIRGAKVYAAPTELAEVKYAIFSA